MNSYNRSRNMSPKGTRKQAMPAPKLMAIENEYLHTKDALEWEIRRLRGEVGVLAKRYNNARREIEDLVRRVRSQPPPPIPKRNEETEREREEQSKRWKEYLEKESKKQEEEKRKERLEEEKEVRENQRKEEEELRQQEKVDKLERMIVEIEERTIAVTRKLQQPTPEPETQTYLSSDNTPLNQKPPSLNGDENEVQMTDVPEQTQLDDACSDVEMAATVRKEIKIAVDERWLKRLRKKNREFKEKEYMQRAGQWWEDMVLTKNVGIEIDLERLEETAGKLITAKKAFAGTKEDEEWERECRAKENGRIFRNAEPIDAFFHLWATELGQQWEVVFKKDHISVTMERSEGDNFVFSCQSLG